MTLKVQPQIRTIENRRIDAGAIVFGGAGAFVSVIFVVFVVLCVQGYQTTSDNTHARAQRAAASVAEGIRWILASSGAALVASAEAWSGNASPDDALVAFAQASDRLPQTVRLHIYSPTGALQAGDDASPDISDTEVFQRLASLGQSSMAVQRGDGGSAAFSLYRSVYRVGEFMGVAVATLPSDALAGFAVPQDLGAGAAVSVISSAGWVVARDPPLARQLALPGPVMEQLTSASRGSYLSESSPADGVARVVGFEQIEEWGLIAVAAIARDTAFAGLWNAIWVVSLLLAPFAVVLLAGSFATAKVLRRMQSTSRSLAEALERNETLFREVHHRVKNNLQSVNALLQLHAVPADTRKDLSSRIGAMSAIHEHMYRSNQFSEVDLGAYLHELLEQFRASADPRIHLVESLASITVDNELAGPVGLILNEVLINCFKHAFPEGAVGTVAVSLRELGDQVELLVSDDGVGFDPTAPGKGIGRRLVRGLAQQIRGQHEFTSGQGSEFRLTFPAH